MSGTSKTSCVGGHHSRSMGFSNVGTKKESTGRGKDITRVGRRHCFAPAVLDRRQASSNPRLEAIRMRMQDRLMRADSRVASQQTKEAQALVLIAAMVFLKTS